ncbi:hypothetical protein PoB_002110000 [Plakobranchus ocellatus]|uniref:Uncharacterized protein n=1 Tax=Plakobranchus ocellatus TaxID=259542 RepID=A0AAV3ZG45_9GAST|nr:hypothetical protein PoB_002110000 [Plakobranchus ocellatus]
MGVVSYNGSSNGIRETGCLYICYKDCKVNNIIFSCKVIAPTGVWGGKTCKALRVDDIVHLSAPTRVSSSSHGDETDFAFVKPSSSKPLQRKASSVSGSSSKAGGPRRTSASTKSEVCNDIVNAVNRMGSGRHGRATQQKPAGMMGKEGGRQGSSTIIPWPGFMYHVRTHFHGSSTVCFGRSVGGTGRG